MVGFQVKALVALHRVARAVPLREAEAGEALDLSPHLLRFAFRIAALPAIVEELPLHQLELRPVAVADVHPTPYLIGLLGAQPSVLHHHPHHILLVHHHPIGLGHDAHHTLGSQLAALRIAMA